MRATMILGGLAVTCLSAVAHAQAQNTCPSGEIQLASTAIQLPALQAIAASPNDAIVLLCAAAPGSNRKDRLTAFAFGLKITPLDPIYARAKLEGCPAEIVERGFGERPRVSTRLRGESALEIRMSPADQPRCVATGFIPIIDDEVLVAFEHSSAPETPHRVRAADSATLDLLESGRHGSGRMSVEMERDSELAKLLRAWFARTPRQRIPAVHVEFYNALITEVSLPSMDAAAPGGENVIRVKLTDVLVTRLTPKTTRNGAILMGDFNYREMSRY